MIEADDALPDVTLKKKGVILITCVILDDKFYPQIFFERRVNSTKD